MPEYFVYKKIIFNVSWNRDSTCEISLTYLQYWYIYRTFGKFHVKGDNSTIKQ